MSILSLYTYAGGCLYSDCIIKTGSVCNEIVYLKDLILQQDSPRDGPLYTSCTKNLALVLAENPKKGCPLNSMLLSEGA